MWNSLNSTSKSVNSVAHDVSNIKGISALSAVYQVYCTGLEAMNHSEAITIYIYIYIYIYITWFWGLYGRIWGPRVIFLPKSPHSRFIFPHTDWKTMLYKIYFTSIFLLYHFPRRHFGYFRACAEYYSACACQFVLSSKVRRVVSSYPSRSMAESKQPDVLS